MRLGSKLRGLLKVGAILIIVAVFAVGCSGGQSHTGIWTKFSDMQLPPNAELENSWTEVEPFETCYVYRGILTLETRGTSKGLLSHPGLKFDNAIGSTAEIKMKLLEGPVTEHDASLFSLQDGTREGKVCFFNDRIEIFDANVLKATHDMDTTDGFHIYRLAIAKSSFEVYVNGERIASVTLVNSVPNRTIVVGDGSVGKGENISAQIDYIAYSVEGALTPWGEAIAPRSPPTAPVVDIIPDSPQKGDDLVCSIITESTDPEGDAISYSFAWYRDEVLQPELTTDTLDSSNTECSETWKCLVTPNDGILDGPSAEDQVTIDIGMWTKFSGMQVLPDAEEISPWQASGTFETKVASGGNLTIETRESSIGFLAHPEDRFDNATGSTAEIKIKLMEGPATDHDASLFSLQDGAKEGKVCFFNDRIEIFDANVLKATHDMDTTDGFHIYRLAIAKRSFEVYVDGERVASVILVNPVPNKAVFFGDGSVAEGENLSAQIDYIAYSVKGAVAPRGKLQVD